VRRRALVTGATGGLGRTLVPMLWAAGWIINPTGRRPLPGEHCVALDLTRVIPRAIFSGVDTVFHLAALSSPWGPRAAFEAINVDVTRRIAEMAARAGCRRLVHVSTPSIYAEARDRIGLTEADPPARRFANAYAATKWRAERLLADAPLPVSIVRPRAIVGPDDMVLLPRLLRVIRKGRVPLPGGGAALVELTDVRDVARALIAAADAPPTTVNISGGASRSLRAIVERIAERLDRPIRIAAVPRTAALAGAGLMELAGHLSGREPPITRYGVKALGWSQTFDLSHARAHLGWSPAITPEAAIDHALSRRCAA
jgi:nucleoside-diphosphate-sugar epimerase